MFDVSGKLVPDYQSALKDPEWPKKLYKAECDAYKGNFFTKIQIKYEGYLEMAKFEASISRDEFFFKF